MNTIALYVAGFLLLLVVLSKIPGLEHLVRPLIDIVFTLLKEIFANAFAWFVWGAKLLINAHTEVIRNLLNSAEAVDPTMEMRKKT